MAGPLTARLDQPVGSILEEPDGSAIIGSIIEAPGRPDIDDAILGTPDIDDAILGASGLGAPGLGARSLSAPGPGLADIGESAAALLSVPNSPPAPAWLTSRPARGTSRRKAVLALTSMLLVAVVLGYTAITLAIKGLAAGPADARATTAGRLVIPAPATAGGLPRHSPVINNRGIRHIISQFRQRFAGLLNGSTAAYPAGLYNEPGRVDLTTGTPAWVMYLGFNERPQLADPVATVSALMTRLAGPHANVRPWQVTAGPAGGAAKCVVTVVAQTQVSVCGWATDGAIGALLSPTRDTTVSELAMLMSLMRPDFQAAG